MKYVSIDLELTGLDAEKHQIIEFAAIIEDSKNPKSFEEIPKFRRVVLNGEREYLFSSYACQLNSEVVSEISYIENSGNWKELKEKYKSDSYFDNGFCYDSQLLKEFKDWLLKNDYKENEIGWVNVIAAGKNYSSCDKNFIKKLDEKNYSGIKFHHRAIDPGTSFINWDEDTEPPSTELCTQRAGLVGNVSHKALPDAWNVIQLLRTQYVK